MTDSRRQNTQNTNGDQFSLISHPDITDIDVTDRFQSESPETSVYTTQGTAENCTEGSCDQGSQAFIDHNLTGCQGATAHSNLHRANASTLAFIWDSAETSGNQVNRGNRMPLKPVCIGMYDKNTECSVLRDDVGTSSFSMEISGIENAAYSETSGPVFCGSAMEHELKLSRAQDSRSKPSLRVDIPDDDGTRTSLTNRNVVQMEQCVSSDHDTDLSALRHNQPERSGDVDHNDFMDTEFIDDKSFMCLQDRAACSDQASVSIPTAPVKIFQDVGALGVPSESSSLPSEIGRTNALQMNVRSGHPATTENSSQELLQNVFPFMSEEQKKHKVASLNYSIICRPHPVQSKRRVPIYRRVKKGVSKPSAKRRLKFDDLSLRLALLQLKSTDTNKSNQESSSKAHGFSSDTEQTKASIPIPPQGLCQDTDEVGMETMCEMSMSSDQAMTGNQSRQTRQNRTPSLNTFFLTPGKSTDDGHINFLPKKGISSCSHARRRLEFDHLPSGITLQQPESLPTMNKGNWQSDVCTPLMQSTYLRVPVGQAMHQTVGTRRSSGQDVEPTTQSADRMQSTCVPKSPDAFKYLNERSFWRNLRLDYGVVVNLLRNDMCSLKTLLEENGRFVKCVTICSSLATANLQIPLFAEHVSRFCHNIEELTINFSDFEERLLKQIVMANKLRTLKVLKMFVRSFTSLLNCIMSSADLQELEIHLGDEIEVDMDVKNVEDFLVTVGRFLARNQSLHTVKFLFPASVGLVNCILRNCPSLTRLELKMRKIKDLLLRGAFDVPLVKLKTLVIHSKDNFVPCLFSKIVSITFPSLQELELATF